MSTRTKRQEQRRTVRQAHKEQPFQLPHQRPNDSKSTPAAGSINKSDKTESPKHDAQRPTARPPRSLPVHSPDLGLPTMAQYFSLESDYICSLSSRKQEKALISQDMFDNIWDVLHDPSNSKICTPQFRWWVRKMFILAYSSKDTPTEAKGVETKDRNMKPVVLHENRPVAVKTHIYSILCYCHQLANHGGRDRTTAMVRKHYSWIPKELIAKFVKACPTCQFKKSGVQDPGLSRSAKQFQRLVPSPDMVQAKEEPQPFEDSHALWALHRKVPWMVPSVAVNSALDLPSHELLYSPIQPQLMYPISDARNDSSLWLASLASQPGPCTVLPPIRRIGSENDAGFPVTAGSRVKLPPLMKALSDGTLGLKTPLMPPPPGYTQYSAMTNMYNDIPFKTDGGQGFVISDTIPIDPALLFKDRFTSANVIETPLADNPAVPGYTPTEVN